MLSTAIVNLRNIFLEIEIFDEGCFSIQPFNSFMAEIPPILQIWPPSVM